MHDHRNEIKEKLYSEANDWPLPHTLSEWYFTILSITISHIVIVILGSNIVITISDFRFISW